MLGAMLLSDGSGIEDDVARALEVLWVRMGRLQYQGLETGLPLRDQEQGWPCVIRNEVWGEMPYKSDW
jgi:hypothetical protein